MPHALQHHKHVHRGQEVPDGVLVTQALAGDQRAFERLFDRYQQPLLSYISSIVRDSDLAHDVLQHVFFQLYTSLPILLTDVPLKQWLLRVARNRCFDELRRKSRRKELPFSSMKWECGEEELSPVEGMVDSEPLPEEVAEYIDLQALLQRATASLPPKFRAIVQMHCFKHMSFKEIGHMLRIPEPTVKTYYYRSLPILGKRSPARGMLSPCKGKENTMEENKCVVYVKPGKVSVETIDYPKLELPPGVAGRNRICEHGVILRVVATNICGSDLHMVRGRTTAHCGQTLGHEITGEIIELGRDVQFLEKGDLVSVPFNIACGRCRMCKAGHTGVCLNVNPARPGAAYGYVDMGGWLGGQAKYVMVPYADFNLLKFPDREQAMAKIMDLTMLSDIFPSGYHGAFTAGVTTGSTVYVAGAGPVGLACAASAQLLGAAVVIVGDLIPERLEQARSFGCETVDLRNDAPLPEMIAQLLGEPEVDAAVDCVGFEAHGHGSTAGEAPATAFNDTMAITRAAGRVGIPGLYVTHDPGGIDEKARVGQLDIRIGLGWAKSLSFVTGQCPVMRYHRQLMMAILHDRVQIAKAVNATAISLQDAPEAYREFDQGVAKKFVLDPHGLIAA